MWDSIVEQEYVTQVDFSPFSHLLHYPYIFHNYFISVVSFEESFLDDVDYNHTLDSWDVSFTFEHGEKKLYLPNLSHPSSDHLEETKGEISCFQSSPLYVSSNHEDAFLPHDGISDHGCHDLFID